MKALETGLDFTLIKGRDIVLRLVQIPGGEDVFKENKSRLSEDLWNESQSLDGDMSTSNAGRLRAGYTTKERTRDGGVAVLGCGGVFAGQSLGLCDYVISGIHVCFCPETERFAGSTPSRL